MQDNKLFIDPKIVEEEKWFTVLTHENFHIVRDYINKKIESYRGQIDQASDVITQDNTLKIMSMQSKIKELKSLLAAFDTALVNKAKSDIRRNAIATT